MSVSESLGYKVPDKHMHGLNQLVPKCFLDDELQGSMNGDYDNKPIERLNRVLSRICTEETLNVVPIIESSALNIDKKKIVGKGGKAYVWSGKMKSVKSILDVAVKATKNEDTKTTLRHVEQQMLKLNQENFVDYYGIYHDVLSHDTYIVMELLRGMSLAHHLKNSFKKMTFKIKIDILHQSAVAIAYAHSKDILVTDFKPDNIVFEKMPDFEHNSNLHIKLIDVTENDFTVAYSSRDALEFKFSKETDIYTFGVVVWQLFTTGQRPYSEFRSDMLLALEIGNGRQLEIPSDIHVGIKDLILACWKSPCEITMDKIVNILSEMQIHADAMEYVASPIPFDLF